MTAKNFDEDFIAIANSMGISLYQRFSINEASLFLRISANEVKGISQNRGLNFIQITDKKIEFFGYQLLEYMLHNTTQNTLQQTDLTENSDRIIRAKEVQNMTGLSRTTLWRLENKNEFPNRVGLGANSVGWKLSEVQNWIDKRN
ncbi:hypothetical protein [uncultured Gammaproteobacteria bacterium]|nr:hypothetical protein [uncultured Gammaproteobacteria bacterium]